MTPNYVTIIITKFHTISMGVLDMIKRYSSMFKYKKNIKYGFKDLISKQIISQFQWGLKISVKTVAKFHTIYIGVLDI
jgi:hypothetical protein